MGVKYTDIIDLVLNQNIVGLFQGKSEGGPRALGNRSLIFDPRNPKAKDIVNQVKRREWYRPFAGTVLLEHAQEWFHMRGLKESPFMMYAMKVKEDKKNIVPGIVHVDGTCRIQTVTQEQNYHYYNLIKCFYEKTNVPILFNTSFNLGGRTLVYTQEDGIKTLQDSMIEYMYLPEEEKLIIIKN
jgi:carbamoyltransferase